MSALKNGRGAVLKWLPAQLPVFGANKFNQFSHQNVQLSTTNGSPKCVASRTVRVNGDRNVMQQFSLTTFL